jgi:iron only hydrogenase large subunit-like protein
MLTFCLYLSGRITSAETVMLQKQSLGGLIDRINSDKVVIVFVSPQSRASLVVFFGLSQLHGLAIFVPLSESSPFVKSHII